MSDFFTADLHLGCRKVYKEYAHPFPTYDVYEKTVIDNINSRCYKKDTLYIIGDLIDYEKHDRYNRMSFWEDAFETTRKIHCQLKLVLGNNETRLARQVFDDDMVSFTQFLQSYGITCLGESHQCRIEGVVWNLTHRITSARKDMLNMYGHQHREDSLTAAGINASIALTGYYPLSTQQVMTMTWRTADYTIRAHQLPRVGAHNEDLWKQYEKAWHKKLRNLLPYV